MADGHARARLFPAYPAYEFGYDGYRANTQFPLSAERSTSMDVDENSDTESIESNNDSEETENCYGRLDSFTSIAKTIPTLIEGGWRTSQPRQLEADSGLSSQYYPSSRGACNALYSLYSQSSPKSPWPPRSTNNSSTRALTTFSQNSGVSTLRYNSRAPQSVESPTLVDEDDDEGHYLSETKTGIMDVDVDDEDYVSSPPVKKPVSKSKKGRKSKVSEDDEEPRLIDIPVLSGILETAPPLPDNTKHPNYRESEYSRNRRSRHNTKRADRLVLFIHDIFVGEISTDGVECLGCEKIIKLDSRGKAKLFHTGWTKHREACWGIRAKMELTCLERKERIWPPPYDNYWEMTMTFYEKSNLEGVQWPTKDWAYYIAQLDITRNHARRIGKEALRRSYNGLERNGKGLVHYKEESLNVGSFNKGRMYPTKEYPPAEPRL